MAIVITLLVVALAFLGIHYAFTIQERRRAAQEFEAALAELEKDPDSKPKRDAALVRGKTYWSILRNGPARPEDEVAVNQRIQAIIYRDTLPANRAASRIGKTKIVNTDQLRRTRIEQVGKETWNISGRTKLRQLRDELGFELEGEAQETLASLIERHLIRQPKFGDHVVIGNLDIAVIKVSDGQAVKLFVRRLG